MIVRERGFGTAHIFVVLPFALYVESMLDKIKSMLNNGRSEKAKMASMPTGYVGSYVQGAGNPFACYQTGSYDNTFSSITRIAEAFAEVMPYAIDEKGEKIKTPPAAIKALYSPNREMSGVKFFETLAVMALVHPTVYILCWHQEGQEAIPGGPIKPNNIAGFTFLENPNVMKVGDKMTYRVKDAIYTDDDVIAISLNVNPYDVTAGYSPSLAAKKWSTVDDYVVDYQAGFFKNGAIPEGQFIITARTPEEFNDTVNYLEKQHRGAGRNGKVNYVHRPVNDLGQASSAQIEWVPYGVSNKDLTLQAIFDQANKKIDTTFGVPEEVKGFLQNSNYASAEVADYVFARRVVYPKLVKIWADFTHELNRITGGLGYAVSFDFEMPMLSDEMKVKAEAEQIKVMTLTNLLNQGFSLESVVAALELPEDYLKLNQKTTPQNATETPEATDDGNDTVSDDNAAEKAVKKVLSGCKFKLPTADPEFEAVVRDYMQKQIDAAIAELNFNTKAEADAFAERMWISLEPIIQQFGATQYDEGYGMVAQTIGVEIPEQLQYVISETLRTSYKSYLRDVALSYTDDTAASIRRVLAQGDTEGWDNYTVQERLGEIMDTDDWRVQRLARTESHRAEQLGSIDAMQGVQKDTGVEFVKVWHVNPGTSNHCAECMALDGTKQPLDKDFGNFKAGLDEGADAHPNCSCYLTYEIVSTPEQEKSVKVTCPECGRYLFETKSCSVENIICTNSKCKKHFNFKVSKGEIKSEEVK